MTTAAENAPRYCDLVMKGGITSGLVYPKAVIEIGKQYRFRSIGGTSAGAIAAALSAAAALGERRRTSADQPLGLLRLGCTAAQLSSPGKIFSLFQPVPKLRHAFRLLVKLSAKPSKPVVAWLVLTRATLIAPLSFLLSLGFLTALAFVIARLPGVCAAALPALACALAFAAYRAVSGTADELAANMLGMCPGTRQGKSKAAGLSDWMHLEIRALAGLGEGDGAPVVFGDLWDAPLYADEPPRRADERTLSLEVITTDVSHSEPRTIPFARGTLWYLREEFESLFPKSVLDAMASAESTALESGGKTFLRLPEGRSLPIVVAARMSLSFPVLICAVPLYEQHFLPKPQGAVDERSALAPVAAATAALAQATEELTSASADADASARFEMRVCWFTDGGVSSNFPLHLFDAPMPRWPTFAIDLVYPPEGTPTSPSPVFLPSGNNQGWRPRYTSIERQGGLQSLGAFLSGIVGAMQNWRDLLQGRAPGHRDRIVQVEVAPSEGGMNLNMGKETLDALADKGELAGKALQGFDFENHFWVRYRNLQAAMERYGVGLHHALERAPAGAEDAYKRARSGEGRGGPYPFTVTQAQEAARRLELLLQEMALWEDCHGSLAANAPNPPPSFRITPTF